MRVLIILAVLCALPAMAQTVAVNDTIYAYAGQTWTGQITLSWPAFTTTSGRVVGAGSRVVQVTNGVLSVSLYPVEGLQGIAYTARYLTTAGTSRGTTWTETWTPAASPNVQSLSYVRASSTYTVWLTQIERGGAMDGQVATWSTSQGKWVPASTGISASATWAQIEAGTAASGNVHAATTWAQIEQ